MTSHEQYRDMLWFLSLLLLFSTSMDTIGVQWEEFYPSVNHKNNKRLVFFFSIRGPFSKKNKSHSAAKVLRKYCNHN